MDTADRIINNRAPKRIILWFVFSFILSAAAGFFISDYCAKKITEMQIRYVAVSVAGGRPVTEIPDDNLFEESEKITEIYGITSQTDPRVFESFVRIRNIIYSVILGMSFLLCSLGMIAALRPLFRIYRDMDGIAEECSEIAENGGGIKGRYGGSFSCIRKVSDGISSIGLRMNYIVSGLEAEKDFLRDFLTDFSHQLKTSLAVIRLNNDMLDSLDNLTEEKADQLSGEINDSIDDMETLVFSALKLAKLNAGSVQYEMTEGSLSDVCIRSVQKVRSLLESKHIVLNTDTDINVTYSFDDIWLTEAVTNLIKNSADHSGCSEICIGLSETPCTAVITVSDNGKGIPQAAIPGIFERFGKSSRESGMSSVGVGMSIAEKIIRAHNGEILIYSGEGKGTRFEIIFLKQES